MAERARNEQARLKKAHHQKARAMTTRANAREAKEASLTERKALARTERANDGEARDVLVLTCGVRGGRSEVCGVRCCVRAA